MNKAPKTLPIILHIDFDSFFASVEQQYQPHLRDKPIGVTAHNGRTAIISASREAKKMGVKNVMRTYEAFKICPDLKLVSGDFDKYWEISKQFIRICKDYSPYIEVFSLDELFIDVTYSAHLFGGVISLVQKIKQRVKTEIGEYITVSVGVSHNKLLAKLASGLKKPDGIVFIAPQNVESVYAIAKLTDICGIGSRIKERLNLMGIYTLLKLRKAPLDSLIAEFGNVEGHFLYNVGKGVDTRVVNSFTEEIPVKSVGRNYCLPHNEYDKRIVLQNVYELCEEVGLKLRRIQKKARLIALSLTGEGDIFGHITYNTYFDTGKELYETCLRIIYKNAFNREQFERGYVRQIRVWTGLLMDTANLPLPLLPKDRKKEKITKAVDILNDKFGHHTIRNGFLLYADKLTTKPNGFMGDAYEKQKLARYGV